MKKPTLTVIIVAKNEGTRISTCVKSAAFADEVLVLDSGSTDDTAIQAEKAGAIVHITDWPGYGPQQQRGISMATSDWVLSLDADEHIGDKLRQEIQNAMSQEAMAGYRIPRYSSFCGTFINHSGWRPDYTLRLVRRSLAGFTDHFLHAHMTANGIVGNLQHPIIHFSYRDIDDALEKMVRYSRGSAIDLKNNGKSSTLMKALLKSLWSFVRTYIIHCGFLDGRLGLVLAIHNSHTTYYKYLRLWLQEKNAIL